MKTHGGEGNRDRAQLTWPSICPVQAAVAQCFEREQQHFGQPSSYFLQLPQAMKLNRDHMIRSLQSVGLQPLIPLGSYFLIADISDFSEWYWPCHPGSGEIAKLAGTQQDLFCCPREQDARPAWC